MPLFEIDFIALSDRKTKAPRFCRNKGVLRRRTLRGAYAPAMLALPIQYCYPLLRSAQDSARMVYSCCALKPKAFVV
jgi:hypothetical protein